MARGAKVDDTVYVARATGIVRVGDTEYRYVNGKTRIRAGHPLLRVHPEKFKPEAADTEKVVALRAADAPRAVRAPDPELEPVVEPQADPEPEPDAETEDEGEAEA